MQEYSYYYEGANFYCYPDSNVLINKFGIKDNDKLEEIEGAITLAKNAGYKKNPIKGNFNFEHFCKIHKFLFEEIYEWAGKGRKGGFMTKGKTVFVRSEYIENEFNEYYEKIKKDKFLKGLNKESFCEKLAVYMAEVNTVHPFREGNGRTARLYFNQLANEAGYDIEFSKTDKDELILSDILAYDGNYVLSIEILNNIVSPIEH